MCIPDCALTDKCRSGSGYICLKISDTKQKIYMQLCCVAAFTLCIKTWSLARFLIWIMTSNVTPPCLHTRFIWKEESCSLPHIGTNTCDVDGQSRRISDHDASRVHFLNTSHDVGCLNPNNVSVTEQEIRRHYLQISSKAQSSQSQPLLTTKASLQVGSTMGDWHTNLCYAWLDKRWMSGSLEYFWSLIPIWKTKKHDACSVNVNFRCWNQFLHESQARKMAKWPCGRTIDNSDEDQELWEAASHVFIQITPHSPKKYSRL